MEARQGYPNREERISLGGSRGLAGETGVSKARGQILTLVGKQWEGWLWEGFSEVVTTDGALEGGGQTPEAKSVLWTQYNEEDWDHLLKYHQWFSFFANAMPTSNSYLLPSCMWGISRYKHQLFEIPRQCPFSNPVLCHRWWPKQWHSIS